MGDITILLRSVTPRIVMGVNSVGVVMAVDSEAGITCEILADTTIFNKLPPMSASPPTVVAIVYQRMSLFELGIVAEVFGSHRPDFPGPLFTLKFAQAEPGELRAIGGLRLQTDGGLRLLHSADIVVLPGWRDARDAAPVALQRALVRALARGARVVSICSGAFVLASAGMLDGRRATTHWRYVDLFRERFPLVDLDPDVLYVEDGPILTSAGSAAGIDACLQVVRRHYGAEVANTVARAMVTNPHRAGGQAQYVHRPVAIRPDRSLAPLLEWARRHLGSGMSVSALARRAAVSDRTLLRKFISEVGITPKAWLQNERIAEAQRLLESTETSLDGVAEAVGYSTLSAFRTAFRQTAGVAPAAYRISFRK
jgi:AraC family transcriptional regulator, transcriptional activator FtrA